MTLTDLQQLCAQVRNFFPGAIIAGGAVRDTYFGKPVKDIDVMVSFSAFEYDRAVADLASALGGFVTETANRYTAIQQCDVEFADGRPPINVINRGEDFDLLEDMHDFDFHLSQIAVTPSGLIMTDAFRVEEQYGTLTYNHDDKIRPDWHVKSSADRMKRLMAKYPNRTPRRVEKLFAMLESF